MDLQRLRFLWIPNEPRQNARSRIPNRQISVTDAAAAETTADVTAAAETLQDAAVPEDAVILLEEADAVTLQEKAAPAEDPTKKGAQTDVNA